jgi:hypothetical protein
MDSKTISKKSCLAGRAKSTNTRLELSELDSQRYELTSNEMARLRGGSGSNGISYIKMTP